MLTSFDRQQWYENFGDAQVRDRINASSPELLVRSHYPYRAIITKGCRAYGLAEGDVFPYARTKHTIGNFPIEVTTYGKEKAPRSIHLGSDEAQLIEV